MAVVDEVVNVGLVVDDVVPLVLVQFNKTYFFAIHLPNKKMINLQRQFVLGHYFHPCLIFVSWAATFQVLRSTGSSLNSSAKNIQGLK